MHRLHVAALAIALALVAQPAHAFYGSGSAVINLEPSNFDKKLKGKVTLVEFYAPWCGHCKNLTPEWERAAAALKGILPVAAVDADAHRSLGAQWGVKGFPTIKLLYTNSKGELKAADYSGARTAKDIAQWALGQATKLAMGRLGAKASSGGSAGGSAGGGDSCGGGGGGAGAGSGGGGGGGGGSSFYPKSSGVVNLDDSNFHSQVGNSDDMWFIEFYAPWCGHCKALKPAWTELAGALDGKVRVGAVDCTANQATCGEFGVQGFPTLKFFGSNKERPEEYNGGRDVAALSAFATERWARDQPPPEVRELTDDEVWVEHCRGHPADPALDLKAVKPKQLCLVAFLPHILDAKAKGRNVHLDMLRKLAEEAKDRPFAWFWAEGGAQPGLEANVGVGGYGYPAFVALNPEKGKFAALRGGFEAGAVRDFLSGVRNGRERVAPVEGALGALETRSPWDGGDGVEEVEEEFSLEDLGIGSGDDKEL